MSCKSCQQHRDAIQSALENKSLGQTVTAVSFASIALGEDVGRKLVKTTTSIKTKLQKGTYFN
jgi:hypothetical protein